VDKVLAVDLEWTAASVYRRSTRGKVAMMQLAYDNK
jgi:hypothetical protein